MPFCPYCGTEYAQSGIVFCPNCSKPIQASALTQTVPAITANARDRVREMLPGIIVPIVFIVAAFFLPGLPLAGRLLWIAGSGFFLFVIVQNIRSQVRKPRPPATIDSGLAPKQYRIEWTSLGDKYDIRESSGNILAHVLTGEPGASGLPCRFMFEKADGRRWGEMRINFLGKRSVFDGENRLLATFRMQSGNVYAFRMDDPKGQLLAENYEGRTGDDYQIVSPAASVIAHVSRGPGSDDYNCLYVDVFGNGLDPLLVYCYVIAIDNFRRYREFDDKYGGA